MSLSIKTIECNGGCKDCYEHDLRRSGKFPKTDLKKIWETLEKVIDNHSLVTIHGGEPLLLGHEEIEKLLSYIYKKKGSTGLQTNGILIDKKYIEMFKKYKTHVGFSIDSDDIAGNTGRWNLFSEKEAIINTAKTLEAMKKCSDNGLRISVIALLNNKSSFDMIEFVNKLFTEYKITGMRVNPCIVFDEDKTNQISNNMLGSLYCDLYDLAVEKKWDIRPVLDILPLMRGENKGTCIFTECDPFHTTAEVTLMGDGTLSNCLKNCYSEGLTLRSDRHSDIRYRMLENIKQSDGGCKDCEFWTICKGGCPGEGTGNDWRNKTRFCEGYKILYRHVYMSNAKEILGGKCSQVGNKQKTGHGDQYHNSHGDSNHGDHTDKGVKK